MLRSTMSKTISLASIASLLLAASATAQVTNTTNADRCLYNIQSNRTDDRVNSTGVVTIPWETRFVSPWSLTMTFNDSGQRSTPEVRWSNPVAGYLQGYLNVPSINNGNAVVCVYMLPGRNVTSTNSNPNAGNSCEGILSNECVDVISQNIKASQNDCPTFPLRRVPRVKEVCGDTITGEAGSGIAGTCTQTPRS